MPLDQTPVDVETQLDDDDLVFVDAPPDGQQCGHGLPSETANY